MSPKITYIAAKLVCKCTAASYSVLLYSQCSVC